jgi:hypothetical protein
MTMVSPDVRNSFFSDVDLDDSSSFSLLFFPLARFIIVSVSNVSGVA